MAAKIEPSVPGSPFTPKLNENKEIVEKKARAVRSLTQRLFEAEVPKKAFIPADKDVIVIGDDIETTEDLLTRARKDQRTTSKLGEEYKNLIVNLQARKKMRKEERRLEWNMNDPRVCKLRKTLYRQDVSEAKKEVKEEKQPI